MSTTKTTVDASQETFPTTTRRTYGDLDDYRQDLSPWENQTISQILLPVLCAIFIAVVVIVIACCLIQKKSKSARQWREKSIHTIETSHDASDHGIYDVIDEMNVSTYQPDKPPLRRHDKLTFSCLLASQHDKVHHPKSCNVFTTKSSGAPFNLPSTLVSPTFSGTGCSVTDEVRSWPRHEIVTSETCPSRQQAVRVSCAEIEDDEEGIYETLDRHWELRKTYRPTDNGRVETAANRPLSFGVKTVDLSKQIGEELFWSCRQSCYTEYNPNFEESSNNSTCLQNSVSNNAYGTQNTSPLPFECQEGGGKIVCQLTMFCMSSDGCIPTPFETAYYNVSFQELTDIFNSKESYPSLLQSSELRVVPVDVNTGYQQAESPMNLILKPLKNQPSGQASDVSPSTYSQNEVCSPREAKIYDKFPRSASRQYPIRLVKKSESFRAASSEVSAGTESYHGQRRRSDSCQGGTGLMNSKSPNRQPNITAGAEATRILSKLGPLPPVPIHSDTARHTQSQKRGRGDLDTNPAVTSVDQSYRPTERSEKFLISSAEPLPTSKNPDPEIGCVNSESCLSRQYHTSFSKIEQHSITTGSVSHLHSQQLGAGSRIENTDALSFGVSQTKQGTQSLNHAIFPPISTTCRFNIGSRDAHTSSPMKNNRLGSCNNEETVHADQSDEEEESNQYFVLEPRDDASCSNSSSDSDNDI